MAISQAQAIVLVIVVSHLVSKTKTGVDLGVTDLSAQAGLEVADLPTQAGKAAVVDLAAQAGAHK